MDGLGIESHLDLVLAGRNLHGTQHIVGTGDLSRLAVDRGFPTGIVYLGEYSHTPILALCLIGGGSGCLGGQFHIGRRVHGSRIAQHLRKLLVHDGVMAWRHLMQRVQFLVGVVHHFQLVHKPGVAVGSRVLKREHVVLVAVDEPAGVQHVQHRTDGVGIEAGEIVNREFQVVVGQHSVGVQTVLREHTQRLREFLNDMALYQLLIAAELGRMIAAHAVIEERGGVVVERAHRGVENAVVALVAALLQDIFVDRSLLACRLDCRLLEKVVVHIALVHLPHVGKAHHDNQAADGRLSAPCHLTLVLHRRVIIAIKEGGSKQDDEKRAPGVGLHHRSTHLRYA